MDKKNNLVFILVILTAGIIAYSNSFDCSFHFDDRNILNSSTTKNSATLGDWIRLFPARPLGVLTFAANYHVHSLDVWGYHLVNLMIHLINSLLVWLLTWMTFSTPVMKDLPVSRNRNTIAFLTGLLFVTHPLATQSVTYIVQRFTSLATLFYLLSLVAFITGRLHHNKKSALILMGVSVLSAACGILTKEIVFTLPFAVILYDYCFIRTASWKPHPKDRSFWVASVMLAVFTVFFFKNYSLNIFDTVPPEQGYSYSISMKEYFLTQFKVILTYIRLLFLPFSQTFDYDYSTSLGFFEPETFFSFLSLLTMLFSGVFLFRKYRLISFGIFWFFLTFSVESSFIPISQNVIFEHRTYLPGVGFFIALTGSFFYFFKEKYSSIALIILLMIASLNTYLTYQRNKVWKNEYIFWSDCLMKSPGKARVNNEFGASLAELGRYEQALDYFDEAIRLNDHYADAYYNRGMMYGKLGQYQKTISDCNEAIRIKPDYVNAYNNRGNAYAGLGLYGLAIESYTRAITLMPDYFPVYVNRGEVYVRMTQYQKAVEDYDRAINLRPDYLRALTGRANVYLNLGNEQYACRDARTACKLGDCRTLNFFGGKGHCR